MFLRTVPMLPCPDIDAMQTFWAAFGASFPWKQRAPNPYLAVKLDELDLHYYGLPALRPEDSHSSCLVLVLDSASCHQRFKEALRAYCGKVPIEGIPKLTRPRNGGGFSLVDPAGNWIRVTAPSKGEAAATDFAKILDDALSLADGRGDPALAAKTLRTRMARAVLTAPERVELLSLLAELLARAGDAEQAKGVLAEVKAISLSEADRVAVSAALERLEEVERSLG